MATPMNFQTLNFGNIPQQEAEARRRYYDSLGSIGGVVANTGTKVDDYLQRKQREAEDKKKWDNMIAQQEYQKKYQKSRDEIQDQRYEDELERKLNEIDAKNKALEDMKKRVGGMYDERRINEMYGYGSPAAIHYHALMSSKDLDAGQTAYNNLAGAIARHDQMKLMREQASLDRVPNQTITQVNDTLSRENIDLNSRRIPYKVNEKRQKIKDVDDIQRQIEVAENQLKLLEPLGPNDNASAKRTAIQAYIKFLKDSLNPAVKPVSDYEKLADALKNLDAM